MLAHPKKKDNGFDVLFTNKALLVDRVPSKVPLYMMPIVMKRRQFVSKVNAGEVTSASAKGGTGLNVQAR